jgi:hypothetical protein
MGADPLVRGRSPMTVLTPAEEMGLSGLNLDSRVRKIFYQLPPEELKALIATLAGESARRRLWYSHAGATEAVRVFARPIGIMQDQLGYLHWVSLTILNALKRLPDLYIQDFSIRSLLALSPEEEQWLWASWGPSQRENNPVIGRLDAVVDFTSPMWKETLRFVEPNLSGVGGIHFAPSAERLLADVVVPNLRKYDATLDMQAGQDFRELFVQELLDHAEAVGCKGRNLCFVEAKFVASGPEEQQSLAEYFRERHGLTVLHADPSELRLDGNEVRCQGERVDLVYRDYETRDLIALAKQGADLRAMQRLFKENRVVSSMAGDFDHKSCWEVLTDPQFTQQYFSAEERQVFRRHVLWTRVLRERSATLPGGELGDLVTYAREDREVLVLKPNRAYGGEGVLIGHSCAEEAWQAAVDRALADPEAWVVQRLANIPVNEFPVVDADGSVHVEPFYTVMGFAPTRFGLGILGRASQKEVVNVAQRGGMCAVLIGRPPGRLHGPGAPLKIDV